jgi:hypothetical protein
VPGRIAAIECRHDRGIAVPSRDDAVNSAGEQLLMSVFWGAGSNRYGNRDLPEDHQNAPFRPSNSESTIEARG